MGITSPVAFAVPCQSAMILKATLSPSAHHQTQPAAQEKAGPAGWGKTPIVLHDSPIVMPLKEWIEQPLVREVIHDGQTLQVRLGVAWQRASGHGVRIPQLLGHAQHDGPVGWMS